jgi:glycosyltransferase involved in cell wall biosynthesis
MRIEAGHPLRVALVTETFPPEIGGVALCAGRFASSLRARGCAVHIVRPRQQGDPPAVPDTLLTRGLPIPFDSRLQAGLPAAGALEAAWRGFEPDVVHVLSEGLLGWSALRAARRLGLPVLTSFHTNFHAYGRHYGLGALRGLAMAYLRRFHRHGARTLVPTAQVQAQLRRAGFAGLAVLGRGVDTALFSPARRSAALRDRWGAGKDDPVALVVGRLAPEKNVFLALRAYRAMKEAHPGAKLVVVGDGPERRRLEAVAPEASFTGMLRGEELAAHYASADVFLFPSLTETFGNVTLEAMASGLALLAYDDAGAAQHVEPGVSGLLAFRGDEPAFLAHAVRLAQVPKLRRRLGAAAHEAVQPLSWERIGDAYLEQLEEVAGVSPAPAGSPASRAGADASSPNRAEATAGGRAAGS